MVTIDNWICKVAEANKIAPESIRKKIKDSSRNSDGKKEQRKEGKKNGVR